MLTWTDAWYSECLQQTRIRPCQYFFSSILWLMFLLFSAWNCPEPPCPQSRVRWCDSVTLWQCDNVILQGGVVRVVPPGTGHITILCQVSSSHPTTTTTGPAWTPERDRKKHIILTLQSCPVSSYILISSSLEIQLQPYLDTTDKANCFYRIISVYH